MTLPSFIRDYMTVAGGSVGRLAVALIYFLIAANVLSLADFGMFATASAAGVILSRVAAFGFISPLFRAATVTPKLTGVYLAGYAFMLAASLPVVALIAAILKPVIFFDMPLEPFVLIITAEVLGWRTLEVVAIINNGRRSFGKATALVLAGSLVRTLGAIAFWRLGDASLSAWAWTYLAVNLTAAALALALFLPPLRLRLAPRLYLRQMRDAIPAAVADITFFVQAELDKAVVLIMAGPQVAGLYAIAIRIIDLTAVPIRSFNQLAMQKIMIDRKVVMPPRMLALVEAGIAAVSTAALAAAIVLLWWRPDLLGRNVGAAAALFPLLIAVPAFRNLIEYHAELLYGLKRTTLRALLLIGIATLKAGLIWAVMRAASTGPGVPDTSWALGLNLVFLVLYLLSATVAYTVITRGRQRA